MEALGARGAARFDPVAFRVLEAMLRRLDGFEGAARGALVRKIERRLAAFCERFERGVGHLPVEGVVRARPEPGPLAALLAHVAHHGGATEVSVGRTLDGGGVQPATELKSLRYFRSTWSRLSLEQQLARALAQAPDNAGPLNSHFLVLQALIRMRDVAPGYLEGFIAYAEALLWLERADAGRGLAGRGAAHKPAARSGDARTPAARARKGARGRAD